jgi:hypothetical protein
VGAIVREEADRVPRVDGCQDLRRPEKRGSPEHGEDGEPRDGDGAEQRAERPGAAMLQCEQADEHGDRQRDDEMAERRRGDRDAFHGAQHGDRRRDHAVAVEEGGAEQPEQQEGMGRPAFDARGERHQGQDAALAVIVGAEDEGQVLDGDDEDQRPGDEREDAEDIGGGRLDGMRAAEAFPERVEGARADIAVDDAERREDGRGERSAASGPAGAYGAGRRERALWGLGHGRRGPRGLGWNPARRRRAATVRPPRGGGATRW